ncbi:MAG: TonB-dependent receptor [Methylococcaceae bacterium]|nr:TonB-dependent receptor [Methylococcaceae bacterium]
MNFSYENSGSFQDFVYADDVFLAPIIRWNISPQTQVTLEMEYQHQNRGYSMGFVPFKNGKPVVPINTSYGEPHATDANTYFVGLNWSHQFNDDWAIKHQFTANKTDGAYPSAYYPNSVDQNKVLRSNLLDFVGYSDTYATNLDLTGHFETLGLKHTLLMGGDYYRTDGRFRQEVGEDTAIVPSIDVFNPVHTGSPLKVREFSVGRENIADQYGLYLQDQIELPYKLFVLGGFRYQYIEQRGNFNLDVPDGSFSISQVNDPQRGDAVTPRVGVLWQPQSWLSLYGNYVESFGQAGSGSIYPDKSNRRQPVLNNGRLASRANGSVGVCGLRPLITT